MLNKITKILSLCDTDKSFIPPTELYNEGWLLRLVIDWFYKSQVSSHELAFYDSSARWYSEALLPSKFLLGYRGDRLAESWTNADGVL